MVDLSTLKKGDKLLIEVEYNGKGSVFPSSWGEGHHVFKINESDIKEVIEAAFDWDTVKIGDAFVHIELSQNDIDYVCHAQFNGKLMRYAGKAPSNNSDIFEIDNNCNQINLAINWLPLRHNLIYKPQYSI